MKKKAFHNRKIPAFNSCSRLKLPAIIKWDRYLFPLVLLFLVIPSKSRAQNGFSRNGDAVSEASCNQVRFVSAPSPLDHTIFKTGSAYYRKKINLKESFELGMIMDVYDSLATDGMALVLTTDTFLTGRGSNEMGWGGMQNSFAVTFDFKRENSDNDPSYKHAAIQINGNVKHNVASDLSGPVNIEPYFNGSNLYQYINFKWDAATKIFEVRMNNNLILSTAFDIVSNIFNGNSNVYWGFTGSLTQLTSLAHINPDNRPPLGYMSATFGTILPRFRSSPQLDTCYAMPIQFFDNSEYWANNTFNSINLARWYWEFGDGTLSHERNPAPHNYPAPGKYLLKFTVTNQIGCALDTVKKWITLSSIPKANFIADPYCTGIPLSFRDSSTVSISQGIVQWDWNFNNEFLISQRNPSYIFSSAGSKQISLRVRTYEGCEHEITRTIVVNDRPQTQFSLTQDCNRTVLLDARSLNTVPVKIYQWDFGNGAKQNSGNFHRYIYPENGNYTIAMTALSPQGCLSDTAIKKVSIDKIIPFAGNDTVVTVQQPLQLMASGGTAIRWQPAFGLNNPMVYDPVAILTNDQTYIAEFSNAAGCTAYDTIRIKVFKDIDLYVPTAFTPNNDGLNDVFNFTSPGIEKVSFFRVYNRQGQLLFSGNHGTKGWDGTYKKVLLPAGTYIWHIAGSDYKGRYIHKKGWVMLIR